SFDGPGRNLGQGNGRLNDHQVDLASHKILHGRTPAAIWHKRKAGSGLFLEQDAGDMRSRSGDRLRRLVRVCFQPGDETLEVAGMAFFARIRNGLLESSATGSKSFTTSYESRT